ncbi:hypothetical protein [Streptomyces sp. HNM0574]|uniref:hypothetical protein n=1 Tax=Streptomyces sp. HNM0574 TaxID=2714954 RepID=UPI00146B3DF6|nr:hypothetical protein [Streptomyces sp. HNM0574]NLU65948.1 hypothetical protein [Streptomyces sp. HNM0574]
MDSEAAVSTSSTAARSVRDVVRAVVTDTAAEELPLVDALSVYDDATVVRRLGRRKPRRDPLGFGLGEIAVLVTPVVWLVLDQAARQFTDLAVQTGLARVRALFDRLRRRPSPPVLVPALTREQLAEVHRRVRESAQQKGLDAERAASVADSVIARLALEPRDDGGDAEGGAAALDV